jgi:hypothetical protein
MPTYDNDDDDKKQSKNVNNFDPGLKIIFFAYSLQIALHAVVVVVNNASNVSILQ